MIWSWVARIHKVRLWCGSQVVSVPQSSPDACLFGLRRDLLPGTKYCPSVMISLVTGFGRWRVLLSQCGREDFHLPRKNVKDSRPGVATFDLCAIVKKSADRVPFSTESVSASSRFTPQLEYVSPITGLGERDRDLNCAPFSFNLACRSQQAW